MAPHQPSSQKRHPETGQGRLPPRRRRPGGGHPPPPGTGAASQNLPNGTLGGAGIPQQAQVLASFGGKIQKLGEDSNI